MPQNNGFFKPVAVILNLAHQTFTCSQPSLVNALKMLYYSVQGFAGNVIIATGGIIFPGKNNQLRKLS